MLNICYYNANRTTLFASGELKKYLSMMGNSNISLLYTQSIAQADENSTQPPPTESRWVVIWC